MEPPSDPEPRTSAEAAAPLRAPEVARLREEQAKVTGRAPSAPLPPGWRPLPPPRRTGFPPLPPRASSPASWDPQSLGLGHNASSTYALKERSLQASGVKVLGETFVTCICCLFFFFWVWSPLTLERKGGMKEMTVLLTRT